MSGQQVRKRRHPKKSSSTCPLCGAKIRLQRKGDGQVFRGRPNYWYETIGPQHECEGGRKLRELNLEALTGGRP